MDRERRTTRDFAFHSQWTFVCWDSHSHCIASRTADTERAGWRWRHTIRHSNMAWAVTRFGYFGCVLGSDRDRDLDHAGQNARRLAPFRNFGSSSWAFCKHTGFLHNVFVLSAHSHVNIGWAAEGDSGARDITTTPILGTFAVPTFSWLIHSLSVSGPLKPPYHRDRQFQSGIVASGDTTLMLLHLIAAALFVGSIAVPVCLLRFVYRFLKPATRR